MDTRDVPGVKKPAIWRRLRFSLKTLLIVVTLLALWLGYTAHRARQQEQVVEAILDVGGRVTFAHQRGEDHKDGARTYDTRKEPNAPSWLVTTIGADYFRKVDSISLVNVPVTDEWLEQLGKLSSLDSLLLRNTNITGKGVARLHLLPKLEVLNVQGMTAVNDVTLRTISNGTRLKSLNFHDCKDITDAGVACLAPLNNLERLDLSTTQVTDAGLAHLSRMSEMRLLSLANTRVTDEGLRHIANMKHLYWLDLRGTQISDDGLQYLSELKKLEQLILWDTQVTTEGAERIRAALPAVRGLAVGTEPTRPAPSAFPNSPGRGRGRRGGPR
jgi:hypothetical protein